MTGIAGRHWRAVIGLCLMGVGISGYVAVLFGAGRPVAECAPTWLHLVRQYGFPALLVVGGYNLFQRGALWEIATAWRARQP